MVDGTQEQDAAEKIITTPESSAKAPVEDVDPALAEWLTVDAKPTVRDESETESETDADSVDDDVKAESDEWFPVELSGTDVLDKTLEEVKEHREVCGFTIAWGLFSSLGYKSRICPRSQTHRYSAYFT